MEDVFVKCLTIVLCVLITATASCTANRQYQARILIESGKADGLQARCALDGDAQEACRAIAMRDMVRK